MEEGGAHTVECAEGFILGCKSLGKAHCLGGGECGESDWEKGFEEHLARRGIGKLLEEFRKE